MSFKIGIAAYQESISTVGEPFVNNRVLEHVFERVELAAVVFIEDRVIE